MVSTMGEDLVIYQWLILNSIFEFRTLRIAREMNYT